MGEDDGNGLTLDSAMRKSHYSKQKMWRSERNAKPADEDEFVEILWMPLEEVMQKIETGGNSDAKTIIATQYAWMHKENNLCQTSLY